jgi:transcriptional regulator with XRE-family HTH domain
MNRVSDRGCIPDRKQSEAAHRPAAVPDPVDARLGARLAELRAEHGWSLGELAERSGVSRSILSRAERAEISPTASLLNRLFAVYGRTMSPCSARSRRSRRCWYAPVSSRCGRTAPPDSCAGRCPRRTRACAANSPRDWLTAGADIAYDRPPGSSP